MLRLKDIFMKKGILAVAFVFIISFAVWYTWMHYTNCRLLSVSPASNSSKYALKIMFDWEQRFAIYDSFPSVAYEGQLLSGELPMARRVMTSRRIVNGEQYLITYIGRNSVGKEGFEENEIVFYLRSIKNKTEDYIDIFMENRFDVVLIIDNFDRGILLDARTGQEIEKPYIFHSGHHHFRAESNETETLKP